MNVPNELPADVDGWDSLLDNAFGIGPFPRSIKADDWWVLTGMHITLPTTMEDRPAGTSKLLVLADTIGAGPNGRMATVNFDGMSDVLLLGHTVNLGGRSAWRRLQGAEEVFRIAVQNSPPSGWLHLTINGVGRRSGKPRPEQFRWYKGESVPHQIEFYLGESPDFEWYGTRQLPLPSSGAGMDAACQHFLARLLLTAQWFFNANRPDDGYRVLDRLEALLALNPGAASWQHLAGQCLATREVFEPQLPGANRVPALAQAVYGNVARSYGPALQAFSDHFDRFVDRSATNEQRATAAHLLHAQEDNAIRFQALVTRQLEDNLEAASTHLDRAHASMEAQSLRVEAAERAFQSGLAVWQREQQRQAALAIASAVFSAVIGVAAIFAGKPADMSGIAQKAAQAGQLAVKLVETLKKLEKIIKAVGRLMQLINEILPHASKLANAGTLAARMAAVRREADASDLNGAPSESAYWDQFWVEVDTALETPRSEGIRGAAEYLQQLKVLIIYGRTLTSAQAAISPIAQELAQAHLLTKLAEEQREAIARQIQTVAAGTVSQALISALWLRHRSVRRAVFAALQDFDAAHRFWALSAYRTPRDPGRPIAALAEDLLDIADMEVSVQQALASFDPGPQDFKRVKFEVPQAAVADFLRDGSFTVHFTPDFGPLAGWGRVGRVRVHEVAAWMIWNGDKRPAAVELTVRTDGDYQDQRVQSGEVMQFHFIGPRVNRTFLYDPVKAESGREASINVRARVGEDFRHQYSEPTLFTGWQFSLPRNDGMIDPETIEALTGLVNGIELEFSGTYIKDADRFF